MSKLKKILIIVFSTCIIFGIGIILFISPLTKYLVEKYDEKYTGRQIKMNWAYVNPFSGYLYFSDLKIYELKSDSVFFSAKGVSAKVLMTKLFSKNYEISELVLDEPSGIIIQNGDKHDLNFNDLIKKFSPKKSTVIKPPVHFSILNIRINNGIFYYRENVIPISYFIKKVNIESSGFRWDADTLAVKFSFIQGIGQGESKGDATINIKNFDYRLATVIKKFDLNIIEQYMKDLTNYGSFRANIDADIKAIGNLKHARDLNAKGQLSLNDFHFGKDSTEDYASFARFKIGITDLSPENKKYIFDSVILSEPFFEYEKYDHLDNIQAIFGKNGSHVSSVNADKEHFNLILEIAKYVEKLAKNFFRSYYKINRLEINKANLRYNDYSLNEKFTVSADPLFVVADSIDKNRDRVKLSINTAIVPYGNLSAKLSINPKDSSDFDLNCHIKNIPLTMFNPYLISYTSFPMDRGSIDYKGIWNVRNGNIQSRNHLVITDLHISDRVRNKDSKWIPIPLLMAFVRERGGLIDYEIPVTGNLNDPKFHLKDAILDLLKNTVVKPPTTPRFFRKENPKIEIEEALTLKWNIQQNVLNSEQEKFVEDIADFLKENPKATVSVYPMEYASKEKEHILFYEAKKKYFLAGNKRKAGGYSEDDSLLVVKMSIKDPLFIKCLDKYCDASRVFTVQEKCRAFVGNACVDKRFNELLKQRETAFKFFFKENETNKRVKIHASKYIIPFNGFSYFKLKYNNDSPEALTSAYEKRDELKKDALEERREKK